MGTPVININMVMDTHGRSAMGLLQTSVGQWEALLQGRVEGGEGKEGRERGAQT